MRGARKRGQTAPLAAIDAVEASTRGTFAEGCEREAAIFQECLFSTQSKALIHAFFGERIVAKIPDIPKETKTYDIRKAAVIGAGTMGGGIAMNYANAGIPGDRQGNDARKRSTRASAIIQKELPKQRK